MTNPLKILRFLFLPFAWAFGAVLALRNLLFNIGILKSKSYKKAVIVIGNLAVGGSGKTPMAEYIISLLHKNYTTMLLSRGYKRKTKGFLTATEEHTANDIGDEPFQVKNKFEGLTVVVDEDRVHGIDLALLQKPDIQAIVLDDAYQHRYVKPGLAILLTDYQNLFTHDYLMPVGKLREYRAAKKRANIIVVTKCPIGIQAIEKKQVEKELSPLPHQKVFFAGLKYGQPYALADNSKQLSWEQLQSALIVCGIANPKPMLQFVAFKIKEHETLLFPDHHNYRPKDFNKIEQTLNEVQENNKAIIITEKDAVKWLSLDIPEKVKQTTWVLPVHFKFLFEQTKQFNQEIYHYVESNL